MVPDDVPLDEMQQDPVQVTFAVVVEIDEHIMQSEEPAAEEDPARTTSSQSILYPCSERARGILTTKLPASTRDRDPCQNQSLTGMFQEHITFPVALAHNLTIPSSASIKKREDM